VKNKRKMPSLKDFLTKTLEQGYTKEDLIPELLKKGYSRQEIAEAFSPHPASRKQNGAKILPVIEKIKLLFSHPAQFFQEVNEDTIKPSLIAYTFIALSATIVGIVLLFIIGGFFFRGFSPLFGIGLIFPLVLFAIAIAGTFVYAGLSHGMIKLVKGKGTFTQTYNACTYSLIPAIILAIIPYIGVLSIIYSIVLMAFGLSEYHNISKGKAVIAALLPVILLLVLVGIFITYLLYSFRVF